MQDPNEDTEWNDILRAKGILPPKEVEMTEEELNEMVDEAAKKVLKQMETGRKDVADMTLDELDEAEDDEDERILAEYRKKRMDEMKALAKKAHFGQVINITAQEYKKEINEAGAGVWVLLLLYQSQYPVCLKLQGIWQQLAKKYPAVKFVQSVSTNCIPNYPDKNVPTVFIYLEDNLKASLIGPTIFDSVRDATAVEKELAKFGVIPKDTLDAAALSSPSRMTTIRGKTAHEDEDDDSD
eukprot:m.193759 g.193759  ORF g.193759 m.193759 type:complete len:240 (+) comp17603_c3_seq1:141-860(+)